MTEMQFTNPEYEKYILASMLHNTEHLQASLLKIQPTALSDPRHQIIFDAIGRVAERANPDLEIVREELRRAGELDKVGGSAYLNAVSIVSYNPKNVPEYIDSVLDLSNRRTFLSITAKASTAIRDLSTPYVNLASDFIHQVSNLGVDSSESLVHISSFSNAYHKAERGEYRSLNHISTFKQLDAISYGLPKKELIVVAARPSVGKTALALNLALDLAMAERPVGYFSLEMSGESLYLRLLSMLSHVDGMFIRNGIFNDEERERILQAKKVLDVIPLYICDARTMTTDKVTLVARREASKVPFSAFFLDYLTLLRDDQKRGQTRDLLIGDMTKKLRELAGATDSSMVVLAQLGRQADSHLEPKLSDLRESGNIEQDADQIWFLWRDEDSDISDRKPIVNLAVAKHREGPVGKIQLVNIKSMTLFKEVEKKSSYAGDTSSPSLDTKPSSGGAETPSSEHEDDTEEKPEHEEFLTEEEIPF